MKTGLRSRYVDELLEEALATDDAEDGHRIIERAREHVASLRLTAHLVAACFGDEEPLTRELRSLHVHKSDDIDAVVARCSSWWDAPSKDALH